MPKAGTEYQELVALVAKALDPNAEIKTGQWVEGPDGDREVDVEVRGTVDGKNHFVLIECKDWKRPVDVQAIDQLESKRHDLFADAVIIYSNSGFTKKALRKASRVGIDAASALAKGNQLVKVAIERELIAKRLSVDSYKTTLYFGPESEKIFPLQWDIRSLRYGGMPIVNWLSQLSNKLMQEYEGKRKLVYTAAFKMNTVFTLDGAPILLSGLRVNMTCSRKWFSQVVRTDVSLGSYNHLTGRLLIPDQQNYELGWISPNAWNEMNIDGEPEEWSKPLAPGDFLLNVMRMNPIARVEGEKIPAIDDLISKQSVETGE